MGLHGLLGAPLPQEDGELHDAAKATLTILQR